MVAKDKNRNGNIRHYVIYIIFGVLTTGVSIGIFALLRRYCLFLSEDMANVISIFIAIIFAYYTNRKYVFKSNAEDKNKEFMKFFISRGFSFLFEVVLFWTLNKYTGIDEMINKSMCTFLVIIINYIFSRFFVFSEK